MNSVIVDLAIDADEYQRLYRGTARYVLARARDGRHVRFPARILQPYVQRDGVFGSFQIVFDAKNKFQQIERLGRF